LALNSSRICIELPGAPFLQSSVLLPDSAQQPLLWPVLPGSMGPLMNLWKEIGSCRAPQHEPRRLHMKNDCTTHTEAV
jgi:hypothetical protein